MASIIDLVSLIKAVRNIPQVIVHGQVVEELPRPRNLFSTVQTDEQHTFVRLDVFAVTLTSIKGYLQNAKVTEVDDTFMVNGSVCLYVPKNSFAEKGFYTTVTSLRFGDRDSGGNYVIGFNFQKIDNVNWRLVDCKLNDLDISKWNKDTVKYKYITQSLKEVKVVYSTEVLQLPKFYATQQNNTIITTQVEMPRTIDTEPKVQARYIKSDFQPQTRQMILPPSETAQKLKDILELTKETRKNYLEGIKERYKITNECPEYIRYMCNNLYRYLKNKPDNYAKTGRMILQKYLSEFKGSENKYLGTKISTFIIDDFVEVKDFITDRAVVNMDREAWEICKAAFHDRELFYASILAQILSQSREEFIQIAKRCNSLDISFSRVVNENPYLLQLLSNLKFNDIEAIAFAVGQHNNRELDEYRNIAMLHSYVSDTNNSSTIFTKKYLQTGNIGVILTKKRYEDTKSRGTHITQALQENIRYYIKSFKGIRGYNPSEFVQSGYNYIRKVNPTDIGKMVADYINSGLGVEYLDYVTSSRLLEKELFIYEFMYQLGRTEYDYDASVIEKYIKEYEKIVGFILEKEQHDAVYLLLKGAGVITGSAGSGKTTVSNCLVYVLEHIDPNVNIQFATPTGKAAKRMQEVVKRPVKTLHSLFKLGISEEVEFDKSMLDVESSDKVYFFDENAMVTIDVFYSVLKKIDIDSSRIFLFGDFNQLPPIGKGLMFKNLLRFMPCVCLTVSKRAAEGSAITYNSNLINNHSDPSDYIPLKSEKDFMLLPCSDANISHVVTLLCKHYLGEQISDTDYKNLCISCGVSELPKCDIFPDDIQVVSPLSKERYTWGTTKLNQVLQPLFNKNNSYKNTIINRKPKVDNFTKLVIGDRVIHTQSNMYNMQWYESVSRHMCKKRYGFGICNGEVGKVVGFFPAENMMFDDEDGYSPDDFEYPEYLRDDSTFCGETDYFVEVEYYDYMSDSNYYILYRCNENNYNPSNEGKTLCGEDLDKLLLFYAGTTHKLQGSQAKLIICCLGDVNFKGFITRNMLYTTVTRGEQLVFCVGSVQNTKASMLTKARLEVASQDTITVGEKLY